MRFARHLDPIVAIATASGRGAIGVLRVSGPRLEPLIAAVCGAALAPRRATYLTWRDPAGLALDRGIAIHYPAPHSYTGEHVLELQAHGGAVVLRLLLARCFEAAAQLDPASGEPRLADLRLAEPGEFTERAFLNGKIDLAQAEAVADLIDARTEAAARAASRSLSGAFAEGVRALVEEIVSLRVLVESTLDFPDEEIEFLQRADASGRLERISARLGEISRRAAQGALLRDGVRVVLSGPPNVGKSSLLNALAGAELAIVTSIPGTTRDRISETIQIDGVPVLVTDTAGLRPTGEAQDEVERIGIERSWEAIGSADVVLLLHDLTLPPALDASATAEAVRARAGPDRVLEVFNKADAARPDAVASAVLHSGAIVISALQGDGVAALRARLLEIVGFDADMEGVFAARARHLRALEDACGYVALAARHASRGDASLELLAEELRLVQQALGTVTGEFGVDDLLGEIFERFCIGK